MRIDFKREKQYFDPIVVNSVTLEVVHRGKIFGLVVSQSLQRNHHGNHVIEKANKLLFCLVQLKWAKLREKDIVNFYIVLVWDPPFNMHRRMTITAYLNNWTKTLRVSRNDRWRQILKDSSTWKAFNNPGRSLLERRREIRKSLVQL